MKTPVAVTLAVALSALAAGAEERQADHARLREMLRTVTSAVNDNQLDKLLPLLDDDFALTMLDQTLITSPDELKAYFRRHFEAPGAVLRSVHIEPEADVLTRFLDETSGVNRGTSTDTYTLRTGTQVVLHTRWSGVFRKLDGRWKIVSLHVGANVLDNPMLDFARRGRQLWGAGGVVLGALLGFALGRRRTARRS